MKTKEKARLLLVHTILYINRRPGLRRIALAVLSTFPALEKRLTQATKAVSPVQPRVAPELANLNPRARRIYTDLKAAIEKRSKEHS